MPRALCPRCGTDRSDYPDICSSCGHRPIDEGLLIAWLLSSHHLRESQLDAAAARIRDGHPIRPSDRQIKVARRALGRTFRTDPGLPLSTRLLLLGCSLLLTPLPAWVCFGWWLSARPRAAWQSFGIALPGTIIYGALGVWLALRPWLEALANSSGS